MTIGNIGNNRPTARTSAVRAVAVVIAALLSVPAMLLTATPASAKLTGTPNFAISLLPAQDAVDIVGADISSTYTVELIRHGAVVSSAHNLVPSDLPKTAFWDGLLSVNLGAAACWEGVTPDMRARDLVRVTSSKGVIHESRVADVEAFANPANPLTPVVDVGGGVIEIHGRAAEADGTPIPVAQLGVQVLMASKVNFSINGRNGILAPPDGFLTYDPANPVTNPDGTRWTARFVGMTAADIVQAQSGAHTAALWLGRDPIAETEMTVGEFSFLPEGLCTPRPLNTPVPPRERITGDTVVAPLAWALPSRIAGATSTFTGTITNPGPGPVVISGFRSTGADSAEFSVASTTCATLAAKSSCSVTAQFSAAGSPGPRTAELVIDDDVAGIVAIPVASAVDPTPIASAVATPGALSFSDVAVGARSGLQNLTIQNTGEAEMATPLVTIEGTESADYSITSATCDVALLPGDSCLLTVEFSPLAIGQRSASIHVSYESLPGQAALLTVPLAGYSSVTADGYNDPPRRHLVSAWAERDAVDGWRFAPDEAVDVEIMRPDAANGGALTQVAHADAIIPRDDPRKAGFDGSVMVNQAVVGAEVSWLPSTPDIRPGDVVRMTAWKVAEIGQPGAVPTAREQTTVADLVTTSKATKVSASSFVVTGWARNPRTGAPLASDSVEVRVVAPGQAKFLNGTATLRGGAGLANSALDIRPDGSFVATFTNVGGFDLSLALTSAPMAIWIGRFPMVELETTASEFGAVPGPAGPTFAPQNMGQLQFAGECALCLPVAKVGAAAVGSTGSPTSIVVTNVGDAPTTVTAAQIVGYQPDDFTVTGGTCVDATIAPGSTCTVAVASRPTVAGQRQATLMVTHSGANTHEFLPIEGTGSVAPKLFSVNPGLVDPGGLMFVNGSALIGTTSLTIGGVEATGVTVIDDSTVLAIMPAIPFTGSAVDVAVTTPGGSATLASSMLVAPPAPTISGIVLPAAPVLAGSEVVVEGTWLSNLWAVSVSGISATWTVNANGSISVKLPAGTPAIAQIDVTSTSGTASTQPFAVTQTPALYATASDQVAAGTTLVFFGSGLTGASSLTVDGIEAANLIVVDDFTITATMPTLPITGIAVDVAVTTPGGTASFPGAITAIIPAPSITGITLPAAPIVAGKSIVVAGSNLLDLTSVTIGGLDAQWSVNADGSIAVSIPVNAPEIAQIDIVGPGGVASSEPFSVVQPPLISAASVATAKAGDVVTFTGTNLGNVPTAVPALAGVTAVRFTGATPAGVVATAVTRRSSTQILVTVPVGARPGPITLSGPAGSSSFSGLTILLPPAVTSIVLPTAPVLAGKVVTINGADLASVSALSLGAVVLGKDVTSVAPAVPSGWRLEPSGSISVGIPAGTPASVNLSLVGPGGTFTSGAFAVVQPPSISIAAPAIAKPGDVVTFTGINLGNVPTSNPPIAGVLTVRFTGATAAGVLATSLTRLSSTQLSVTIPAGARPGPVVVAGPAGATSFAGLTLPAPPTFTQVLLPAAPVLQGKALTVTGTNLSTLTSVTLSNIVIPRDTTTAAPALPRGWRIEANGRLTVTLPANLPASTVLTVTGPGGSVSSGAFAVVQPPRITLAAPLRGRAGTVITLTGTNLGNVPTSNPAVAGVVSVRFTGATPAGVLATAVTRVSSTSMRVTVPVGAVNGPITLTGPAGTSSFSGFTVG